MPGAPASRVLPDARMELIRLAEEGRATALRKALISPPPWLDRAALDRIRAALDVFDLPAIARLLRQPLEGREP